MLNNVLKTQFSNAFEILQAAIPSFAAEQWVQGSPAFNGPARAAAHVLTCGEFYTCEDPDVLARFGKKVWQMSTGELPSQETMLRYLQEVRSKTLAWLDGAGAQGAGESGTSQQQPVDPEPFIYALRHLQHHIGEICAHQKQCGLEPAPWK